MSIFRADKFTKWENSIAFKLLSEVVDVTRPFLEIFIIHGGFVANRAIKAAQKNLHLNPDVQLIFEASLLHDIGSVFTYAPSIDCFGECPYIQHGVLGARFLRQKGLDKHARICERHVGVGITNDDIREKALDIPLGNYFPETIEEKIVCWADKFYSKKVNSLGKIKTIDQVISDIEVHSKDKVPVFMEWHELFS